MSERERVLNRSRSETTHSDEHPEQLCSKAATWPFPCSGLRSRHSEHEVLSIDFLVNVPHSIVVWMPIAGFELTLERKFKNMQRTGCAF